LRQALTAVVRSPPAPPRIASSAPPRRPPARDFQPVLGRCQDRGRRDGDIPQDVKGLMATFVSAADRSPALDGLDGELDLLRLVDAVEEEGSRDTCWIGNPGSRLEVILRLAFGMGRVCATDTLLAVRVLFRATMRTVLSSRRNPMTGIGDPLTSTDGPPKA
jgi:hypothetical protein